MAIKQALIKPLANSLFGGGNGGGGGGGISGLFGSILGALGIGGGSAIGAGGTDLSFGANGASSLGSVSTAVSSFLPHFANGGGGTLGGNPGVDQNTLSLNGNPIAKVGAGEMLSVSPNVAASNRSVQSARPNVTVLQPIHADFTGARTDEQTMREFTRYADARSKQAYDAAVATSGAQAPGIIQRKQTLGN